MDTRDIVANPNITEAEIKAQAQAIYQRARAEAEAAWRSGFQPYAAPEYPRIEAMVRRIHRGEG